VKVVTNKTKSDDFLHQNMCEEQARILMLEALPRYQANFHLEMILDEIRDKLARMIMCDISESEMINGIYLAVMEAGGPTMLFSREDQIKFRQLINKN
jgi:hypothetical protein